MIQRTMLILEDEESSREMFQKLDGWTVCRRTRQKSNVPYYWANRLGKG